MIVFKAFLKILNKNKWTLIFYTLLLVGISYINMQSLESTTSFESVKPKVHIKDNDNSKISKDFVEYMKENTEFIELDNYDDALDDAIFYREVSYYINIPNNYFEDLINGKEVLLEVKSPNTSDTMFAERISNRYIRLIDFYKNQIKDEDKLITLVRDNLKDTVDISMTTKLDTTSLSKMAAYYNFANYSIIASLVFMISMILNSFNELRIHKRITISSMNYKKHNKYLLLSNLLLSFILFIIYVLCSFLIVGDKVLTINGLFIILNMFIFIVCFTAFAILLGNLITNRNAIGGIINVVALGTSFLCGAFVPQSFLPNSVLTIGHIFPSYYYIKSNDLLATIENFNIDSMMPIIINYIILILFTILFIIINNIILKNKRRIA
jgi:ABC-2 type transport system permease protein